MASASASAVVLAGLNEPNLITVNPVGPFGPAAGRTTINLVIGNDA